MAKTLEDKLAGLSPVRRKRVKARAAALIAEELLSRKKREGKPMTNFKMGKEVKAFVTAHRLLCRHYEHTGLSFTLDGKLVGDLAEVIAAELFGLTLCETRTAGVDCHTKDGRSVQVKATGLLTKGPAYTPGEGRADHLIFLRLNFDSATGTIAYNGPEDPVRRLLPAGFTGTKRVSLASILKLDAAVKKSGRLTRKR